MTEDVDAVEFDEVVTLALAAAALGPAPGAHLKERLMARVRAGAPPPPAFAGFTIRRAADDRWLPHPIAGIRMKVLAINADRRYATLLLDVAPGTRFPAHHHGGAEECYVVSGSIFTNGERLGPGDFIHADSETDHGELWTEEGARVILVVPPEEHLPPELIAAFENRR